MSSFIFRCFRNVRKSLESDGIIGRILESAFYITLTNLRLIWLVLEPTLWVIEYLFGKYTMSYMDLLMKTLKEPGIYGVVGKTLTSPTVRTLDLALGVWFAVDLFLSLLYHILLRYTLDELEIAQKEYKEALEKLGEVEEEEHVGLFTAFVESKPFRCARLFIIPFYITTLVWDIGVDVYDEYSSAPSCSLDQSTPDHAQFNPYRNNISLQDGVYRDAVYISYVLKDLTPTTLPGDDYQLFSDLLRSLETRTDISWRVLDLTDIRITIEAAARRKREGPIAPEPFDIANRVETLNRHWDKLVKSPEKPEVWESESDTMFLKPILSPQPLGENVQKPIDGSEADSAYSEYLGSDSPPSLTLSPEQDATATRVYQNWYKDRYRKIYYLKDHPPTPLAWVPLETTNPGIRKAWDMALDGRPVKAGQHISESKLTETKLWKPIFYSLGIELIPFDWLAPGEEEKTIEDYSKELEEIYEENDRRAVRKSKQADYQLELRAQLEKEEDSRRAATIQPDLNNQLDL